MNSTVPTERWEAAVAVANVPTLLMVLVQMTGDERWLEDPYRPSRAQGLSDNDSGGLPEPVIQEIRTAAVEAITAWAGGRPLAIPAPSDELLLEMLSVSLGEPVPAGYAEMMRQEFDDTPASGPTTGHAAPESSDRPYVVVLGAGMSGICASIELQRRGIPHQIIERYGEVGGTWLENRYPGCGVDVPSHLYSYSFAPNDWTHYFALRDEIFEYFRRVAREYGVYERTRFDTETLSARYCESRQQWDVEVRRADGVTETLHADVVISAVGAFNKARIPALPGISEFTGPQAHTARWPEDGIDLRDKRVAVIGTGASAMQVVPAIADTAQRVLVFQRTPQWAAPFEKFQVAIPEPVRMLMAELPLYLHWYRLRIGWAFNDRIYDALQKDPEWTTPDVSINPINDGQRRSLTRYIEAQLGDRTELLPKVLPTYPPFGKRMLLDNGWFRTLRRDDVDLYTRSVVEVLPDAVVDDAGDIHDVDVIVWATGFDVVHFISPIEVVGRSGRSLQETWDGDDARAYLGTCVPDFPNFFVLYGPNTQFGHGGSLITVVERQVHYIMDILEKMRSNDLGAVEVRRDVHDRYNERVDEAHEHMVWTHQGMETYYRNSRGRVVVNNPFRIVDVWKWTETAHLEEYLVEPACSRP
jgi:4-hydroxyacetophenone monooxygenase